jgi:hypothetical protein
MSDYDHIWKILVKPGWNPASGCHWKCARCDVQALTPTNEPPAADWSNIRQRISWDTPLFTCKELMIKNIHDS